MTADELRAARAALGLSARALGVALGGVNPRTVRRWEAGEFPVPSMVALLLERLLAEFVAGKMAELLGKDVAA